MKPVLSLIFISSLVVYSCICKCNVKYKYSIRVHVSAKHNEYYCTNEFSLTGNRSISFVDQSGKAIQYKDADYEYFEITNGE